MGLLEPTPLDLGAPEPGGDVLVHDARFEALDAGACALRDTVNLGIRVLNGVGAGLTELPSGSLRELLVAPLVGDHRVIGQNADACVQVSDALRTLSGDVGRLALAVDPRWGGRAASAFLVRLGAQAAGTAAVGLVVEQGAVVLTEAARFSERMAVEVEGLVVELAEVLGRLARALLTRVLGPGWATLAAEIAIRGLDVVTDLVDDVKRAFEIVDTLLGLQDDVAAWVDEQRGRLEVLLGLPDVLRDTARLAA